VPFPEPAEPAGSRAEVLRRYLDCSGSRLAAKRATLPAADPRCTALPSGWTLLGLARHPRYAELRWPEWGVAGRPFDDPWDRAGTGAIVGSHHLSDVGAPGDRWPGARPATQGRVGLQLLRECARHLGQPVVVGLATGSAGG
jgi:hypothetical protein